MSDVTRLAEELVAWFDRSQSYAVALSGGVDSAVVATAARSVDPQTLAVTARSPSVAQQELRDASQLAAQIGVRHEFVEPQELDDSAYQRNDARRCYFCKSRLYAAIAAGYPERIILSGTNFDDLGDYRPGLQAAAEAQVRAPLAELRINKAQVRQLAQHWGLHLADKPASPCLASRIAHGVPVTETRLQRIERAEQWLRGLGLLEFRVRLHADDAARIEVPLADLPALLAPPTRESLVAAFKELGFRYVTVDLEGFRSGSLNPLFHISAPE